MTQFKEKFAKKHFDKREYNNPMPANQSLESDHTQKSFYDTFVQYYAKFMMVVGIFGQLLFYTQAYKIFITKSANNVSLEGFLISCFSLSCWLIYGLLVRDKVILFVNIVGVAGAVSVVAAILKYS